MLPASQHDLIVARATPPGPGAIAILRADGPGAADLARRLFRPEGRRHPADAPRRAIYGSWIATDSEELIDRGLCLFMRAPRSYTGNDLVEFQCHGGAAVVRRLLAAAVALGARPAEPGEFTRRAFLNGRMDLAQAEAVADLIRAETDAAARAAQAQLDGGLSDRVTALRKRLIDLAAEIEARIDFPDEDLGVADRARLDSDFSTLLDGLGALAALRGRGRLLREGLRIALVGPPNVGKSSLLNALARTDRAIVTPHPGTTRDTVECLIDLGGVPVTLIDTAGIRDSDDPVEALGIERSRRVLADADMVIEVRDAASPDPPSEFRIAGRRPDLVVDNKIDLLGDTPNAAPTDAARLPLSALTGDGLEALEARLLMLMHGEAAAGGRDAFAINERHAGLIDAALEALRQARAAWVSGEGSELVMIDLRDALAALDELLGLTAHEAVLDRIFERFCLGK
jgi:tRNA modification GTPase